MGIRFRTIYADPPWSYDNKGTRGAADKHYGTMQLQDICKIPVKAVADDDCILFLWATSPMLPEAFTVMASWDFAYKSSFVWVKKRMGMGNYWRISHEFLLTGIRGAPKFRSHSLMSWGEFVAAHRDVHSTKPEGVRKLVECAYDSPRLEMWGTRLHEGWISFGKTHRPQKTLFEPEIRLPLRDAV